MIRIDRGVFSVGYFVRCVASSIYSRDNIIVFPSILYKRVAQLSRVRVWVLYRKRVESARSFFFFFFSSSIRNWVDDELSAADCKEKRSSLDDLKGKGTCPFLLFELGRRSFVRWLGGERTVYPLSLRRRRRHS